jgi:redox-sensitive bicupin YhaK (pirin superfamily)
MTVREASGALREAGVQTIVSGRERDLGGFSVRRILPAPGRRMVGPFIFYDHFGPITFGPGQGMDVRPHPHIALATISYLFDGEILHRDSLGFHQPIRPGDVNWMTAGRGIAHSERTSSELRASGSRLHGVQSWVALPKDQEECAPSFEHHPAATLPAFRDGQAELRLIAGTGYGFTAPTPVLSPTLYVHARLAAGTPLRVDATHPERAVYVAQGSVEIGEARFGVGTLLILEPGVSAELRAFEASQVMLLGGAPLGERFIEWNFVSSSLERIERAKDDWRNQRFPKVPGDELEFIPLPG